MILKGGREEREGEWRGKRGKVGRKGRDEGEGGRVEGDVN